LTGSGKMSILTAMSKEQNPPITLDEIREMCKLKGWTQRVLAEELHLSKNTVERWFMVEKYRTYPSWAELLVMARWLKEARAEEAARIEKEARQLQAASA
jgi:DNA-binding transcriptional regulator YiaG